MVTTATAVTSTMQTMEYDVNYNTTTEHNPPEADHYCGRGNAKPKKIGYHRSNKLYL